MTYTLKRARAAERTAVGSPEIMATQPSRKLAIESPSIPDRLYFKIGDVARICGLETYVLRFWESQFPQLKPNKSGTGQRLYRRRDVELVLEIKRLVHAEGYTLPGAKQVLDQLQRGQNPREPQAALPLRGSDLGRRRDKTTTILRQACAELREIASLLASPDPQPQRRRTRITALPSPTGSLFPS
ncbi:MAG TPA: MerR family transcriptional regulator [Terracidiphilus sp.]|nr:MerR family transcriptional regulator [Terracidiphilus sp.]